MLVRTGVSWWCLGGAAGGVRGGCCWAAAWVPVRLGGCGTWVLVWGVWVWGCLGFWCVVVVVCVRGLGGGVMVVCVVWLAVGLVVVALVPPGPPLVFPSV